MASFDDVPFSAVVGTGCLTVVLASVLAFVVWFHGGTQRKKTTTGSTTPAAIRPDQTATTTKESSSWDEAKYPGGSVTIYFATQTGTAESLARDMAREGLEKGFWMHVEDLEDVLLQSSVVAAENNDKDDEVALLQQRLAPKCIFLVSTYGEGEPPDHSVSFVRKLQAASALDIPIVVGGDQDNTNHNISNGGGGAPVLKDVEFAVFGLGNTQYDHYNAMGKFFHAALLQLGARPVVELGLGDDNADLEVDFEAWKDGIYWPAMEQKYLSSSSSSSPKRTNTSPSKEPTNNLPTCPLQITYHTKDDAALFSSNGHQQDRYDLAPEQIHSSSRHYFTSWDCPVTLVRELQQTTDSSGDSTVHVEIDISAPKRLSTSSSSPPLTYSTADNWAVLPVNDARVVSTVATALGYDLDAVFSVTQAPGHEWHGAPFPMPCTVRECLERHCDLTGPPRRSDLKLLAFYCREPIDRSALLRMAAKEGRAEYKEKILDSYMGLVDLLQLCPSLQLPLEHFLNVCSPLQTRVFTISSSSSMHPTTVHLTVAVTKHERQNGSVFHGVCSTHLSQFGNKNDTDTSTISSLPAPMVRVFHRPSSFRLPTETLRPILMIGPGTGIAPMRAFLQERSFQKETLKVPVGSSILYFGCKRATQDFIYQNELEDFVAKGVLTHLRVAFSREQNEKIYVQHLLREHAAETWKLLHDESAHVYVCGGVKMGQDVAEAFKEIIAEQGNMSAVEAKDYLTKLSHDGRFVQELWA